MRIGACLLVVGLLYPAQALAQEAASQHEDPGNRVAVSAFVLPGVFVPMGELGGELKLSRKMAALLALGVGTAPVDAQDADGNFSSERVLCLRVAGQFRYYVWGGFDHGVYAAAELAWHYVDREAANSVRTPNEGLWVGPAAGYKYTFQSGLLLSAGVMVGFPIQRKDGLGEEDVPDPDDVPSNEILFWPSASIGWAF